MGPRGASGRAAALRAALLALLVCVLRLAGKVDVSGAMLWEIVFFQFRGCLFCVGKRDSSAGLRGHRDCSQEKEFSDFRELWIQAIIQLNVIFLHC